MSNIELKLDVIKKIDRSSQKEIFSKNFKELLILIFSEKKISLFSLASLKELNLNADLEIYIGEKFLSLLQEKKIIFSSSEHFYFLMNNFSFSAFKKRELFKLMMISVPLSDETILKLFSQTIKEGEELAADLLFEYLLSSQNNIQKSNLISLSIFSSPTFISALLLKLKESDFSLEDQKEKKLLYILLKNNSFRKMLLYRLSNFSIIYSHEMLKFLEDNNLLEEIEELLRATDIKARNWFSSEERDFLYQLTRTKNISTQSSVFRAFAVQIFSLNNKKTLEKNPKKIILSFLENDQSFDTYEAPEESGGEDQNLRLKVISLIESKSLYDQGSFRQIISAFFSENLIFNDLEEFQLYAKNVFNDKNTSFFQDENITSFLNNLKSTSSKDKILSRFSSSQKEFINLILS